MHFFSLIFSLRPRVHEICDALRVLVQFVQFKKREKHPWRSVIFSKVAGFKPAALLKVTLLHGCFQRITCLYAGFIVSIYT